MANPVVHFEVTGKDGKKLQDFYSKAFGWKVNADNPMNYGIVDAADTGGGIGGASARATVAPGRSRSTSPSTTRRRTSTRSRARAARPSCPSLRFPAWSSSPSSPTPKAT